MSSDFCRLWAATVCIGAQWTVYHDRVFFGVFLCRGHKPVTSRLNPLMQRVEFDHTIAKAAYKYTVYCFELFCFVMLNYYFRHYLHL